MARSLRRIHSLDQLQAALRDLCPVLGSLRDNLIDAGFTREEAVGISGDLLREMYREAQRKETTP